MKVFYESEMAVVAGLQHHHIGMLRLYQEKQREYRWLS